MVNISFDEIVKLVEQLPENQQNDLIYHLRIKQMEQKIQQTDTVTDDEDELTRIKDEWFLERGSEYVDFYRNPSRDELLEEFHKLRGTFARAGSLYGKYANPKVRDVSAEALHAELHHIATEWEQELDDFDTDD